VPGADGDHSPTVDEADFIVWKSNFGLSVGSTTAQTSIVAVPEPATPYLFLMAVLAFTRTATQTRRCSVLPSLPAF
jgi:hypothetical protein